MADETRPPVVNLQQLPHWLQAAVYLGVPSVIAMFLVYVLTTAIAGRIASIERQQAIFEKLLDDIAESQHERSQDTRDLRDRLDAQTKYLERLIRNNCLVAADTNDERALCVQP